MKNIYIVAFSLLISIIVKAQNKPIVEQDSVREQLKEVIINSSRIDLPFLENSRTITIITSKDIKQSAATNVADLLQQFAGVDIRRRGTSGMQADLYIRGGSFDQTLLLIDGIKVEDAQTGHHTMNMALPIEVIERIEIIKGPAARVFGQNAFTGAINIVTKKNQENLMSLGIQAGSYGQKNASVTSASNLKNSSHLVDVSRNISDGYRFNTDYDNQNYFIKSTFNKNALPIDMITSFSERKFGANGFYASPAAINQYEETQTSLVGFSSQIKNEKLTLKPRLYWRRNQDEYVFVRQDPSIFRNLHQTNKVGAEINMEYRSHLGVTGFGVDMAKAYLSSNNLGQRNRFMTTVFFEHLFKLAHDKLDITPGVAINYFSDFKFHAFPGLDIGYRINETLKVYGNIGYTYRIPTYTDLFYSDPATVGDENLDPEEAIAQELGLKYNTKNFSASIALFNRDANKLIDYVKENVDDRWQATNIRKLNTKGFELNTDVNFNLGSFTQLLNLSYSFLEDDVKDLNVNFSRYSINSLKHHVTSRLSTQFTNKLSQNIVYKYAQRTNGDSYAVVDASLNLNLKPFEIFIMANNIFNTEYTETNLVPMPKGNMLFGLTYHFK
ncbi:MAG: TonB-dependent receptor [Flavobacteriales bacterium]|nr:TonB-dependent receptor [Flavobacteriia bacterium]NCP05360.1 TonB-dependent receptor [Flavobacteriales bacterium]PIV92549.1 MAG: TonB-dependent receptor [Flavobacteriaceae bacterium CG17_big_fil_post_rev_8_21_14_2_50_33_15]PIY12651.1 MAG: TonB-dependent receptor [Flavobacteriaceae bacterium CG_4_10_14_3_um_filter_33_47]PJB18089.1 MAG: TonB-dependent receptor [Flavobacteriaceae bacterium CG_4_9_14_3_um_filter_33_16]